MQIYNNIEDGNIINTSDFSTTDEEWYFEDNIAYIKTTVNPVDNIRRVTINEDTDDEIDLVEDRDFIVDYENNKISFINHSIS